MMQYFYDAAGNPAGMGYLFSDEVSNNPDLSIVSRPDGKYQQVAAGNQKLEITYDSVGQPIKLTNAEGGVTTFTYDANGRRKTLTDPVGNTSTFNYNNDGNLIEEVDPLGNSLSYAYDANGNLVRSTDRNGRIREYRYDALNRLVEERWLEGTTVVENRKYGYDAVDNLLSEEDSMGRYEYTYDAANRIETASNKGLSGLPDMMLTYKYDTVGNLTSVSDNTGTAVHSTYDRDNRLTSSYWLRGSDEVLRFNFTYNARNQIKSVERVRGSDSQVFSTSEYAYSYEGLIESIKHNHTATSAVLREFAYTYDETYRPKTKSHGGNTANYEYDKTSQIIAVDNIASADESFSYDLNGNRRMMGYLIERPNRVAETSTHLYGYDLEGNLIRKTDKSTGKYFVYSWDHLNRMTQAEEFSADGSRSLTRVNFYYDVRNRRIGKVVRGGKTIRTVYYDDLAWLDVGESGEVIARYMFGNTIDEILAREKVGNGLASYLPDHLGTIEDVVDVATENVVNNPEYEVFGGVRSEDGAPAGDRFKFTGREYDAETGLFYYRARYYDPGIGRFISEDPIRNRSGDRNFYRYTSNLPVLLTDPSGNSAEEYARNLLNRLGLVTMIRSAVWSGFEAGIVSGICEAHSKGFRNINWSEVAHDTAAVGTSIGLIFGALDLYLNPEYSIKELRPGKGEATAKKTRSIRKRAKKLEERLERTVRNAALIAVIQQTVQCYLDGLNE
jgi:RHS repeat-associated protein